MRNDHALHDSIHYWIARDYRPEAYGIQGDNEKWTAYIKWRSPAGQERHVHDPQGLVFVDENDAAHRGAEMQQQASHVWKSRA